MKTNLPDEIHNKSFRIEPRAGSIQIVIYAGMPFFHRSLKMLKHIKLHVSKYVVGNTVLDTVFLRFAIDSKGSWVGL